MSSCVFNIKLGQLSDTSLMSTYSSILLAKSSETTGETNVNEQIENVAAVDHSTYNSETLTVCGHGIGKAASFLSWLVNIIWSRLVSRFIFRIFSYKIIPYISSFLYIVVFKWRYI